MAQAPQGRPLEGLLKEIISKVGKEKDRLTEESVARTWERAAGKRAARHSRPVSFKKGVLRVAVDGSSWLYELSTKKKAILKKLEGKLGTKKAIDITLRIGDVKGIIDGKKE